MMPRLLEVQINSNVADPGKSHKEKSTYQIYARMRIKYTRVYERLACFFALKFEVRVVLTTSS